MASTCIFCGQKLPRFGQEKLLCGNVFQPVCTQCLEKLWGLSQEERGQLALDTGRAVNPEQIQAFLTESRQAAQRERQAVMTDKFCLRCGSPMLRYGRKLIQLGSEGLFGPITRDGIFSDWLEVEVLRCEGCGKAEFYIPDPSEPKAPQEEEQVTCPVCGTRHSPRVGCPNCAVQAAQSGRIPSTSKEKAPWERSGKRPPWEK